MRRTRIGSAARIPATTMTNAAVVNRSRPIGFLGEGGVCVIGGWTACWGFMVRILRANRQPFPHLNMVPAFFFPVLEKKEVRFVKRRRGKIKTSRRMCTLEFFPGDFDQSVV